MSDMFDIRFRGVSYDKNGRFMVKDKRFEIVRKETKERLKRILEEKLDYLEKMKEEASKLSGEMKELATKDVIAAEGIIEIAVERIAKMVTVDKEGEAFAEF